MIRAVIDTSVFVRALINPMSRCGRILFRYAELFTIIMSEPIALELLEVIQRPELTRKYRGLASLNMRLIIDTIARAEAVVIGDVPSIVRDPNDDIFVATALAGSAEYIVSEDNDLLSLGQAGTIHIVNTDTFIRLFEQSNS